MSISTSGSRADRAAGSRSSSSYSSSLLPSYSERGSSSAIKG
ncbi:hypothetical protein CGRA01v4_03800 [Colletotrichum graminicola]|nr:hypothetical protein CGRA01v4_03800 [Colletotrichum graminicola]